MATTSSNLDFSEFDNLFSGMNVVENPSNATMEAQIANEQNVTAQPVQAGTNGIQIQNVNAPINPALIQSGQAKMQQIFVEMNNLFVERDVLIKLMQLAVVTGTNLLMLGPPGTARFDINA